VGNCDFGDSFIEFWKIVVINESGGISWNQYTAEF